MKLRRNTLRASLGAWPSTRAKSVVTYSSEWSMTVATHLCDVTGSFAPSERSCSVAYTARWSTAVSPEPSVSPALQSVPGRCSAKTTSSSPVRDNTKLANLRAMLSGSAEEAARGRLRHLTARCSRYDDEGREEAFGASKRVERDGKEVTGSGLGIEEGILGILLRRRKE